MASLIRSGCIGVESKNKIQQFSGYSGIGESCISETVDELMGGKR